VYKKIRETFDLVALLGILRDVEIDKINCSTERLLLHNGVEGVIQQNKEFPRSSLNLVLTCPTYPYNIIWVNLNWLELCKFEPHEVIGKTLNVLQQWAIFDPLSLDINKQNAKILMTELEEILVGNR
jgi:hypothetical protein